MPGANRAARRKKGALRRNQDKRKVTQFAQEAQYITALMNQEILRLRSLLDGAGIDWKAQRTFGPAEARQSLEQEAEAQDDETPAATEPPLNEVGSETGSV